MVNVKHIFGLDLFIAFFARSYGWRNCADGVRAQARRHQSRVRKGVGVVMCWRRLCVLGVYCTVVVACSLKAGALAYLGVFPVPLETPSRLAPTCACAYSHGPVSMLTLGVRRL